MSIHLIDSHAHYNDSRFSEEYAGGGIAAMNDCHNGGIAAIINAGTNPESTDECLAIADALPFAYATAGIHPSDAMYIPADQHELALSEIKRQLSHPKAVALGEIGMDYHYKDTNKEVQHYFFERQMEIAREMNVPVVIHDRDAHGDCIAMVRKYPEVRGVFHCFSGSVEMARELVSLGWYISFSGTVSYKNAVSVKAAAAAVPDDRILIETDCPYLAPVPHRGKLNYSLYMFDTLTALSEARGEDPQRTAELTMKNTCRLFSINI